MQILAFVPGAASAENGEPSNAAKVVQAAPEEPTEEAVGSEIEIIEVIGEARQAIEAMQILQRQEAAVVSDTISAELIRKSTDSDAAEIVQRLPAVTIAEDRFLVVRGLGDRYSSALLNGSRLPSTDPDKRVVSLDLFPAGFISSLNVVKSFTPDLPGDFSGGLVDVRLEDAPETLAYSIGVSSHYNTQTTFEDFDTYEGTNADYFGFGADFRDLPGRIPDENIRTPPSGPQQRGFAAGFKNIWDVDSMEAPPGMGLDFSIGNTIGPLGFGLAATYDNEFKFRGREKVGGFGSIDLFPQSPISYTYDRSRFETNLGAVAISSLEIAADHEVQARGFINRNTYDEVLTGSTPGDPQQNNVPLSPTQLQYRDDQLGFGQLSGQHVVGPVDLDWRSALSETVRREPDTRQYVYETSGGQRRLFLGGSGVQRLFLDLDEWLSDSAVDFTLPFVTRLPATDVWSGLDASVKTGLAYLTRNRDQTYRRFQYTGSSTLFDQTLSPEVLLAPQLIGVPGGIQFGEATRNADEFEAKQDIAAGYAMLELPIVQDKLRFAGGVRVEYSYIDLDGFSTGGQTGPIHTIINDLDPLPGLNLIYSPIEDMNVRLGFSQTVSRPEFRELTPTEFSVPNGTRTVIGNPDLTSASINSYDLRWEWFLSGANLVSASFFYKQLTDPIEKVGKGQTSGLADTFKNAEDATIWGFEFEARHDFGPLSAWVDRVPYVEAVSSELANLSLSANASVVESEVNLPPGSGVQTNDTRALQGQPDFVINASIEYSNEAVGTMRMLYNTIGPQIAAAGVEGLPDVIAERRDQLDFVWARNFAPFGEEISAKLSVENILNDQFLETQGPLTTLRYVSGVKIGIGFTYAY